MENNLKITNERSVVIPYKVENNAAFVFLQKRDKDARILPSHFSFFGGKMEEGESREAALEREIREELSFNLKEYSFLGSYPSGAEKSIILHVHVAKVDSSFEDEIKVSEGEYGKFFSEDEVTAEPMLIEGDKKIIGDLCDLLRKNKEI